MKRSASLGNNQKNPSHNESPSFMRRVDSRPDMDPEIETNKNISWVHGLPLLVLYITLLISIRIVYFIIGISPGWSWTLINILHTLVTFPFFHWIKGVPFAGLDNDQGVYENLTWWEQLDTGAQFTKTKKVLIIIPIVILILAEYTCDFQIYPTIINFIAFLPVFVGKLPVMHRVRLLGINKN
eukprot:TRINITY_DN36756_c0_g1_i1.p1 TRINITY_DN36756_c0_g1~~TRINITY_DN36756_c0_g1_i1.p1  ORF type:complete len:183 (-),score=0.54 TRINITY_DN36756_c0_g1_i1:118-666(-)